MEVAINFVIWISAAIFSLLNLFQFGRNVDKSELFVSDFARGWSIIGRSKDISDYEWSSWKAISIYLLPWICIHSIVSEFLRNKITQLKLWYCMLPLLFILVKLGLYAFALMLLQPIVYWFILKYDWKIKWVWLLSSVFLILFNGMKYKYESDNNYYLKALRMTEDEFYMMSVAVFWIQLRCISYCLEIFEFKEKCNFLNVLCYCLYLPLLFLGPVILYNDFYCSLQCKPKLSIKERLYNLFLNIGRYLWWFLFLEFSLHFIYFNALQYNIDVVIIMPDWCLYGGGLWMGLYFYLKYLVTYGIAGSIAALDNIVPETPPLCIARVHLYSQMWKYFDVGLHKFLIRYIYKPVMNSFKVYKINHLFIKSFASLMCFIFVLFWHGANYFILIWTSLNYLGIITENIGSTILHMPSYQRFEKLYIDTTIKKERFYAILSSPILVVSAISNFYFFAGSEIGDVYVNRVLEQSFINFIGMFVIIYSCCRVSQYLNNVRVSKIRT